MFLTVPLLRNLQECRQKLCILALCTILGAAAGAAFAGLTDHSYLLLMRAAMGCRVSIVGTVVKTAPFLVSAYLVIHSKPRLVYFISGFSVCMLTAALWAARAAFGSAGWLVSLLLHFPFLVFVPMLLYFAVCNLMCNAEKKHYIYALAAGAITGMIDYALLSPFLARLTDTYETMGRYAIHVGLDRCI